MYLFGYVSIFLVLGTRYLHLNLKSEVGGPAKAMGFCRYGSEFEPRHSLPKKDIRLDVLFVFLFSKAHPIGPLV